MDCAIWAGFIVRIPDPEDRRSVLVLLTDKSKETGQYYNHKCPGF